MAKRELQEGVEPLNITLLEYRLLANFPPEVQDAMKEHMFWNYLNYDSPPGVKDLYGKRSKLHLNSMMVEQCVMDVNNVLDNLQPDDVSLFKSRLSRLANFIEPLF
jgi:hypothetical protein